MRGRRKPVHLVLDSLPAHKTAAVRDYVASTKGRLTLHFLPGYAPDLNPDELCGVMSSAPAQHDARSARAKPCATRSNNNWRNSNARHTSFGHSFLHLLSPILATAE